MENKSHALAAGSFVLALLTLLIAMAVWLTRDSRQLQVFEIASSEAVNGLQPQATVRFKGVNVGKVSSMGLDPKDGAQVLIRIAISDQVLVTASSYASLGFQGVTGLAYVQLDDSGQSKEALQTSARHPARLPMRASFLSRLGDQGAQILSQLDETARRLNLLLASDNQHRLMSAIASMDQAALSIRDFSSETSRFLPQLVQDANDTLKIIKDTSVRVGESADEARRSARAFRSVTERMNAPGGTLDQITDASNTLAGTGQNLNSSILPRANRVLDEATRAARQVTRAVGSVSENPQSLLFGNSPIPPGPGEPGFLPPGKPP